MNTIKLSLTIMLVALTMLSHSGWSDVYKEARKKAASGERPWFVDDQIQQNQEKQAAHIHQAIAFPEVEALMENYQSQSHESLEPIIQSVEPALLSQESKQIQRRTDDSSIGQLLAGNVDLTLALSVAYQRNPTIQAASQAFQAALQRYPQGAYLEGILSQYNAFTKRLNLLLGGMQPQKQKVDAEWPFPGLVSLRGDLIQTDVDIAKQDYSIALRDVFSQTNKVFHELIYIDHAIEITK
ncbi:hypothetical protein K8I31_07205, partial [bacterium]|nr:hypothetical protein [bacterium]